MKISPLLLTTLLLSFSFGIQSSEIESKDQQDFKLDPFLMNPVSHFINKDQWQEILRETSTTKERKGIRGEVVTIDTRNQKACLAIRDELLNEVSGHDIYDLCDIDENNPMVSVIRFHDHEAVEYRTPINFPKFDGRYEALAKDTRNIGIMGLGMMAAIFALPEDVSNWRRDEMKLDLLGNKWKNNVKNGPVVDKDDWAINYIGHPYFGAAYYTVARHQGFSAWESFGYSALMSTFFWEYGLEAFAEKPSIQDLLVTPIIGALIGEQFYKWDHQIRANGGTVLGSKALGSTSLFLMNPAGQISKGINNLIDNQSFIKEANTFLVLRSSSPNHSSDHFNSGNYMGLRFELKF